MAFLELDSLPSSLFALSEPPRKLFYLGDRELLDSKPIIAIIGTRKPNTYTQTQTTRLAAALSRMGATIISGGALGTDIIAHSAALPHTICVLPTSLDRFYPASNASTISAIAQQGLILSEYKHNLAPKAYHFLHRNRLIIALSDMVIIPQADRQSGSLSSAQVALKLHKPIYTLSHRIGESLGTQDLLTQGHAQAIYDIEAFSATLADMFQLESTLSRADSKVDSNDEILNFAKTNPSFEEAFLRFGDKVLEYELTGLITRANGRIMPTH